MGSPDLKVKQLVYCFHCLLSAIVCSILVLLWQGYPLHKGLVGGRIQRVVVVGRIIKTPFPFPFYFPLFSKELLKYISTDMN